MSEDPGKQMVESLAMTRRLFGQISKLIQAADSSLAEAGWECSSTNKCTDLTGHVGRPKKWMPQNIYRIYNYNDAENTGLEKDISLFIGVLLDQDMSWQGFDEPWLTFGLFQFAPGHAKSWDEDWVKSPLEARQEPNGTFFTWDIDSGDEGEEGFIYEAFAAIPLISIESMEDLKIRLIEPLLQEVESRLERES